MSKIKKIKKKKKKTFITLLQNDQTVAKMFINQGE